MTNATDDSRDPVEEIAERFIAQLRAGEETSIGEYQAAYPEYADQIAALFPTLLLMEDVKPPEANPMRSHDSTDTLLERNLKRLGDFRIIRRIGYGGMGIVYEAEQESLGRRVAMKIFAPTLFSSQRQIRRFEREAQAAAKLHHSNIVPVLGVGEQWGIHYYIMQYITGHPFDRVLSGRGRELESAELGLRRNWSRIAEIGSQIADALQYAHTSGVLHRDIKPGNLLLDENGTAWITDFGLAKMVSQDDGETRTGQTVGTLRYMAPEQLGGEVDQRSDIYSLGLTLYELLTWRPAYDETDRSQLVRQKTSEIPPRPRAVDPLVPRDLETIVTKAIAREPKHRYQTAGDLSDDLQRFANDLPISARRVSSVERLYRWARRNPALAVASALVLGLATSFAAVTAWGYVRVQREMRVARRERQRAVEKEAIATGTLDHIFEQFGIESIENASRAEPILSSEATVLLEELINYYDQLAVDQSPDAESPDGSLQRKAAEAQLKIGNMRASLGQYEEALAAYAQAYNKFQDMHGGLESQLKLARISNHLAQVTRIMGESGEAQILSAMQVLDEALHSSQQRSAADDSSIHGQLRYERARSNFLLATGIRPGMGPESMPPETALDQTAAPRSPTDESRLRLNEAAAELEALVEEFPNQPAYRQLLARCLRERAGDHLSNRTTADQRAEQRSIEILESLVTEFPGRLEYQFDLVETLAEFSVFTGLGPYDEQLRERVERAIELGESLVTQRPDVTVYASALVHAHFKLAQLLLHELDETVGEVRIERINAAEQHFRATISEQAALIRRFPSAVGFAAWQALFRQELAALLLEQGDLDEAQYQVTVAIFLIEELMLLSTNPILDDMESQAYETLEAIFSHDATPPRLLFGP